MLAQNAFGRSALTDAFAAQNPDLLQLILEHPSASEDKLVPKGANSGVADTEDAEAPKNAEGSKVIQAKVHQIVFNRLAAQSVGLLCREVGLSWMGDAFVDTDANTDTTGVVLWAASVILSQWIVKDLLPAGKLRDKAICELGAGQCLVVPSHDLGWLDCAVITMSAVPCGKMKNIKPLSKMLCSPKKKSKTCLSK